MKRNRKNPLWELLSFLLPILGMVAVVIVALFLSKTIFEAVINSDMPDWLKYILLK